MAFVRDDIKKSLRDCGRSIADLARELDVDYPRLSGALNGYWSLKTSDEQRIRGTLREWVDQQQTGGHRVRE